MCYFIKVTANKAVFGEMFSIEREMSICCSEDEMRALNLIHKMTHSPMINVCIEVTDEDDNVRGRIETDCLGSVTLYVYHIGQYNGEVIKLWDWRDEHKMTAIEVQNIIHLKMF